MRVVVTGAGGFVGRALVESAPQEWALTAVLRSERPPHLAPRDVHWVGVDLTRGDFVSRLPREADVVVHLAQSRHDRDFPEHANDIVDVNVRATALLLDYARRAGVRRFVLASTATIYRASDEPLTEDAPLDTSSLYAASKRSAELVTGSYGDLLECRILRIFTTYGPAQRGRLVANLVERVRSGAPVVVEGRRGTLFSPIYIEDLVDALVAVTAAPGPGSGVEVFNVGGPECLSVREIAEAIGAAVGGPPAITLIDRPEPGGWVADRTRLMRAYDIPDPVPFAEGIRRTVNRFLAERP